MLDERVKAAIDELQMPDGPIRISAGHLVTQVYELGVGDPYHIGFLSVGAHKKGQRRFDALGGAIALTDEGHERLYDWYEVRQIFFDLNDLTYDARGVAKDAPYARTALSWLADLENAPSYFEADPSREVMGELTEPEHEGLQPPLSADDLGWSQVRYDYIGVAVQPPPADGAGTSVNSQNIPSRRIFHIWQMGMPAAMLEKLLAAKQVAVLDWKEFATTNGGRQKGNLTDGTPLGDNLGLKPIVLAG